MSVIFCLQHKNHHKVRCQERKCSETWNPLQTHLDAACQGAHGVLMLSKCFFSAQVCISEAFVTSSISEPYKTFHDLAMPQLWEKPDVCAAFLRLSLREQLWRLETAILNPYLCKWRHSSSLKGHRSINVLPCNHDLFFLTLRPYQHVKAVRCHRHAGKKPGTFFYGGGVEAKWTLKFWRWERLNRLSEWHPSLFAQLQNTTRVCAKEMFHFQAAIFQLPASFQMEVNGEKNGG